MCRVMEEYAKEYAEEHAKEYIDEAMVQKVKEALKKHIDIQYIADVFGMSIEKIKEIEASMQ